MGQLTGFMDSIQSLTNSNDEILQSAKKELSSEERKIVNFFEKKMMQSAVEGNVNEVMRLSKKMNQKLKDLKNADTNK
jgi:hypothetical protein